MNAYVIPGIKEFLFNDYLDITKKVCEITKQKEEDVIKRTRKREIVFTRQICMSLAKLKMRRKVSLSDIGENYGGYDHATVLHAMKTVKDILDTDKNIREDIGYLFSGAKWPSFKN